MRKAQGMQGGRDMKTHIKNCTLILAIGLSTVLLKPQLAFASPTVSWSRQHIAQLVTPSYSTSETVQFTTDTRMTGINVQVVSALRPYIEASPTNFAVLLPGTVYTLTLQIHIPGNASMGVNIDGTIHLVSGPRTIP